MQRQELRKTDLLIQEGEKDPDEQSWGYFCDIKINVFLFWIVS